MKREITTLTGLRGIAAFTVIVYHFNQPTSEMGLNRLFHVPMGYLAVDAFFMLSGFVLSFNYARLFKTVASVSVYGDFLVRRFARIYPAYFGVGLLYVARLVFNVSGDHAINSYTRYDIVGNVFMATGWGLGVRPIVQDSWSVSAEMMCYLLFPLLVAAVFSRRWLSAIGAIGAAGIGFVCVQQSGVGSKGWLDAVAADSMFPLLRAFCGFTLGMAIFAIVSLTQGRLARFSNALTLASLVGVVVSCWEGSGWCALLSVFLLVLGLAQEGFLARALFASRPVLYLGRISYSLYLVHLILVPMAVRLCASALIVPISETSRFWLTFVTFMIGSILVANASYELFEKRGQRGCILLYQAWKRRNRHGEQLLGQSESAFKPGERKS